MDNNDFERTVQSLFGGMNEFVTSKTVVGDPIHVGDTIILPLVDVTFGVGAGTSTNAKSPNAGGGLGGKVTPTAVLVISGGNTKMVNVKTQDGLPVFSTWFRISSTASPAERALRMLRQGRPLRNKHKGRQQKSPSARMGFFNKRMKSCALDFAGSQAMCANISMLRSTVNKNTNSLDIGFPHMIGSSMRMAHIIPKVSTLSTNGAYSHR
jgi:uncharacterized spore protein YtfJ